MATTVEGVTLGDFRAVAKEAYGIRIGEWTPGDPNNPLIDGLQEMADDITGWFNPDQGWQLAEVRTGLISSQRMAESTRFGAVKLQARREEPDQFTPVFHFQAERPPMRTTGLLRRREALDLDQIFDPNFRANVGYKADYGSGPVGIDILPEKVGPVYPLAQALKELSSPYYLVGVTLHVAGGEEHARYLHALQVAHVPDQPQPEKPGPMKHLNVVVYMRDLMDYTRFEANRLRRARRQLDNKFPPPQPAPEVPAQ